MKALMTILQGIALTQTL